MTADMRGQRAGQENLQSNRVNRDFWKMCTCRSESVQLSTPERDFAFAEYSNWQSNQA